MATFAFSLESLKKYDAGADGAMGTANPVAFTDIVEDSTTFTIPEKSFTDIKSEDIPGVRVSLPADGDSPTVVFESHDISNAQMIKFFGGTEVSGVYTPPASGLLNDTGSFEMVTKPLQGVKTKWEFPLCQFSPSMDASASKTGLVKVKLTIKILTPVNASGVALPFFKKTDVEI